MRRWVAEVLGRLAVDDDNTAALRETVRMFLLTGDNYSRTADQLLLHRNTVKDRVSKVLEERGCWNHDNRLDVALALQACHLLGAAVLQFPPRRSRRNARAASAGPPADG